MEWVATYLPWLVPIINVIILPLLWKILRQKTIGWCCDRYVEAAEEMYGNDSGEIKKAYVHDKMIIRTNGKMSDKIIDSYIESSVRRMKAKKNVEVKSRNKNQEKNIQEVKKSSGSKVKIG